MQLDRTGAVAGWIVASIAILTALVGVSSRAGSVEQRVTALELSHERDTVKLDKMLDSVARIEAQLQRRQIEVDSKP